MYTQLEKEILFAQFTTGYTPKSEEEREIFAEWGEKGGSVADKSTAIVDEYEEILDEIVDKIQAAIPKYKAIIEKAVFGRKLVGAESDMVVAPLITEVFMRVLDAHR